MDNRYKIILTNNRIYREIELWSGLDSLKVGTEAGCEVRLKKEWFFEEFYLFVFQKEEHFEITCSGNTYLTAGDDRKYLTRELVHGDRLSVNYQGTDSELLTLNFMLDFDYERKVYNREIDVSNILQIYIGGSKECDVAIEDALVGKDTLTLYRNGRNYSIFDNNTRYGVYVNGERIDRKRDLKERDFFSIAGYSFFLKGGRLYTTSSSKLTVNNLGFYDHFEEMGALIYPRFNRNTRIKSLLSETPIPVLDPPQKPDKPKQNLLMTLFPALGMLAITILLRGIMGGGGSFILFSVCSMTMGIATSVFTYINSNKDYNKEMKERTEKYNHYMETKRAEIIGIRQKEKQDLEEIYYSYDRELDMIKTFSGDLFDRSQEDQDFLHVLVGTGALPARRRIEVKEQETLEVVDELMEMPGKLSEELGLVYDVPVVCDFKGANGVGVVGEESRLYQMIKNFILDISIRHYQKDVKLVFIIGEEASERINWVRLLPHINNEILGVRNLACDDDSKSLMLEFMYKVLSEREASKGIAPHYVVMVFKESGIQHHPISQYIEKAASLGFTFVFFEAEKELLPKGCKYILNLEDMEAGTITDTDKGEQRAFRYIALRDEEMEQAVLKLAPVYCDEISLEGSLTKNISLYELLHIQSAEDLDLGGRWGSSQVDKSMAAPLGVRIKEEPVCLDLHEKYHGPHGLVAGTTGSGKSEILQSYILSMASLFHPYEVAFVIIDFKGGGMVNQFKELPHLVGAITNIDGKEIDRSLQSIKAELQKRQRLFAACDVNHIDAYIRKYKTGEVKEALPHLIVIVDEFAELKAEQPEFMKELISAARIGRSLGVHLILATQKPAGQVNEQIWSNSKFKLCLKVQTKEDSNEVLKSPLAAEIKEPGRAYLQVGNNEIFELFQSAYSGAPAQTEGGSRITEFALWEVMLSGKRKKVFEQKKEKARQQEITQLDALVEYIAGYCEKSRILKLPNICLPPLPTSIPFVAAKEDFVENVIKVSIGIYDNPASQFQGEAVIRPGLQNTMIIGSAQYGKTNLLQEIIRGLTSWYSPKELNLYIIDFGSMVLKNFESLHHVGGVVSSSEDEKLKNLFKLLLAEIKDRKEKLISVGVSSYASYREAGYKDLPQIITLIDNLTALKELYLQDDETLLNLCREGLAVGLSFVVANSQTAGIGFKYLSNFSCRIGLYCNDSGEYGSLFDYCRIRPENTPGRCIVEIDKRLYECQTYLAFEGEREIDRAGEMKEFIAEMNGNYPAERAKLIPVIPKVLTRPYMEKQFRVGATQPYQLPAGLDYSTVEPVVFPLQELGVLALMGRDGMGKGTFIKHMLSFLEENHENAPVQVVIVDNIARKLEALQEYKIVTQYSLAAEAIPPVLQEWEEELEKRYGYLLEGEGDKLQAAPLLLLVINHPGGPQTISEDAESLARYKKIISKYKALKVSILFTGIENAAITYASPEVLKTIRDDKHFIVFEDLNNVKLTDVPTTAARAFKKAIEPGDAYYIKENRLQKIKTVLI